MNTRTIPLALAVAATGLALASLVAARPASPPLVPGSCDFTDRRSGQAWILAVERVDCAYARSQMRRLIRRTVPDSGILVQGGSRTCAGKPVGRAPWDIRCVFLVDWAEFKRGGWFHAGLKTSALGKTARDDLKPARCPNYKDTSGKAWEIRRDDVTCGTVTNIIGALAGRTVPSTGRYSATAYRLPMQCAATPPGKLPTFFGCIAKDWTRAGAWAYFQARVATTRSGTTTR